MGVLLVILSLSHNSISSMHAPESAGLSHANNELAQKKLTHYLTRLLAAPTVQAFDAIYSLIVHDSDLKLDEAALFALAFCRIGLPKN